MEIIIAGIIIGILGVVISIALWCLVRMWLIDYASKKLDSVLSKYFKGDA